MDANFNNIIIRRRIGILNGKKLNVKPIGFGEGNYLRKFSIATSLHGVTYLGERNRPFFERSVLLKWQYIYYCERYFTGRLKIHNLYRKYN